MPDQWTIIRSESFNAKLVSLKEDYDRFDELFQAIDWTLSRNPRKFCNRGDNYYIWKTGKLIDDIFPVLRILYKVYPDNSTVELLEISEVKVDEAAK